MTEMMDLSNFGNRELNEAKEILDAIINNGYPDEFQLDGVSIAFNANSGIVFLTNSEYQVAVESEGKLVMWYILSYDSEGTCEDLHDDFKNNNISEDDYEELADIFERNGKTAWAEEVRAKIN